MDSVHDPSHPDLLDTLAEDFRTHGYDIRRLVRSIALCQAYQLEARPPASGLDPASFAWYHSRPLTAEQLARSMQVGLRGTFDNQHPLMRQLREKIPEVMPETIVSSVGEALFLSNNLAVNQFVADSCRSEHWRNSLSELNEGRELSSVVQSLYLSVLGRAPDTEEAAAMQQFLKACPEIDPRGAADQEEHCFAYERFDQAAWALLTSAEFRFNH
jgi:hypothetical protein